MRIGFAELMVVLLAALFVAGPEKLPYYAKKLGKALAEFRRASAAAAEELSGEPRPSAERGRERESTEER